MPYVYTEAGKAALAQIGRFAITGSFSMVIKNSKNGFFSKNKENFHHMIPPTINVLQGFVFLHTKYSGRAIHIIIENSISAQKTW